MLPIYRLLAVLVFTSLGVLAQVDRATLSGVVTDPSGAVLASASIVLDSPTNGFKREVKSAANGSYQLPGLPIGTYTVSVSLNGFSTSRFDSVVLAVGQSRVLDAQLQVGAVASAIEVNAAATPL